MPADTSDKHHPHSQQQEQHQTQDGFDQLEDIIESFSNPDPQQQPPKTNTKQTQPKIKLEQYPRQSRSICGCGHTYSCNSALYYHIKNKHNNTPPPGTIGTAIKDTAPSPTFIGSYLLRLKTLINGNRYQYFSIYLQKMPRQRKTLITVFSLQFAKTNHKPKQNSNKNSTEQQTTQADSHGLHCKCREAFLTLLDLNLHIRQKHLNWRSEVQSHPHGSFVLEEMKEYNRFEGTLLDFVDNSNGVVRQIYECRCGLVFSSSPAFGQHLKNHEKKAMSHPQLLQFNPITYDESNMLLQSHPPRQITKNQQYPKVKPQMPSKQYLPFQTKHQPFRKLYFCGICSGLLDNCPQLVTHIEQRHKNDQQSKRSLQTIERQKLILRIAVPFESPQLDESGEVDKFNFVCGCGHNYSCSSSLNLHIRRIHSGIAPPGTVGGPRGLPKQRVEDQY